MKSMFLDSIRRMVGAPKPTEEPLSTRGEDAKKKLSDLTDVTDIPKQVEKPSATTGWSLEASVKQEFDRLARRIAKGELIPSEQLLPFLSLERKDDRVYVNYQLGCVHHYAGKLKDSQAFIERAWFLSGFDSCVMESFKTIQLALGNTTAVREAHKRLGLLAIDRGDISRAIEEFDQAHFTYGFYDHIDRWEYDYDIMAALDRLALLHRASRTKRIALGKIRVGYLLRGVLEINSILLRHTLAIAGHHDKSKFEVFCFVPESEEEIQQSAQGNEALEKFRAAGCTVFTGPKHQTADKFAKILSIAEQIRGVELDILVTSAGLVDYSQYLLCALKPAPVCIGFVQGPPPQFAPPSLDWCIAWSRHPMMDTPVNCTLVPWKGSASEVSRSDGISKESLSLPSNSIVILSGGRIEKFQNLEHWLAVSDVLKTYPRAYYLVAGPTETQLPFLRDTFDESTINRVKCLGWRNDFPSLVSIADVVLDTYPNGGGQSLVEAMIAGVPILSHRNDFMQIFDQTNWSPVEDFISDDEMLVRRGDFPALKTRLAQLIQDEAYRKRLGQRCRDAVSDSDSVDVVAECELIFKKLMQASSN